jgi:type II secretory pathway pseudopilin PulG
MRGFTVVESLMAFFVMAVAFVALMSVFSGGAHEAMQSRNRTVALLYAESFLEEVRAHPYGAPAPKRWKSDTVRPVKVQVEGREQVMEFSQEVSYANKSFVGGSSENTDEVTLRLRWKESLGTKKDHHKELVVKVPVWR